MDDTAVRVGVIGCGKISDIYLTNCSATQEVEVVACADLDEERAREKAALHGVPVSGPQGSEDDWQPVLDAYVAAGLPSGAPIPLPDQSVDIHDRRAARERQLGGRS